MKTIKVKFIGFNFDYKNRLFYKLLEKHYNVVESDEPDYVICSIAGKKYDYCNYPQPRIMYTEENYIPDFNLIDYAIQRYPITFQDRVFHLPGAMDIDHFAQLSNNRRFDKSILKEKVHFANFIYSHDSEENIRGDFFKKLSEYKYVESAGMYLNNQSDGISVWWEFDNKIAFQRKCKFTICFESTCHPGFITEKMTDALYSGTIPIYYGSDDIKTIFNEKAFVNCSDYPDFNSVIDRVIEIDNNDDEYLKILNEPPLVDQDIYGKMVSELEEWLCHIFDQPISEAYRRSKVYSPVWYNDYLANCGLPEEFSVLQMAVGLVKQVKRKIRKK